MHIQRYLTALSCMACMACMLALAGCGFHLRGSAAVPVAAFGSRLLTSGAVQRVGEYVVTFNVQFTLTDAQGKTVVPMQAISLSHEFAIDQTQFSAITSETEAIQRSLVREMTDAVMRRLEAQARLGTPVSGSSSAPASASSTPAPATPVPASTSG